MQRKTQEPTYGSEEFAVASDDLQYLSTLLIEDELPRSVEELARALVLYRCRQEDAAIQRAISKGTPYRPSSSYGVGEQVVFPLFDYRVGEVTGVRPGRFSRVMSPMSGTALFMLRRWPKALRWQALLYDRRSSGPRTGWY